MKTLSLKHPQPVDTAPVRKPRRYRSPSERYNARMSGIFERAMALRFGADWRQSNP